MGKELDQQARDRIDEKMREYFASGVEENWKAVADVIDELIDEGYDIDAVGDYAAN